MVHLNIQMLDGSSWLRDDLQISPIDSNLLASTIENEVASDSAHLDFADRN